MALQAQNPQNLKTYLGNPSIKADGVIQNYTQYEIDEYIKCSQDPVYFIKNYIFITHPDKGLIPFDVYDYQEEMINTYKSNRFVIVLSSRQSGKTETSAAYLLWYSIFQPDKTCLIVANKADAAQEVLSRITAALENLPFFLQPGCKVLNKRSLTFSNNSRIVARATSKNSARGLSISVLYADEFAFVQRDTEFYSATYPVVSAGANTQIIITSTPQGVGNTFYKIWEGASQKTNKFTPIRIHWSRVPGRNEKWKEETLSNMTEQQFNQEFNCQFIGSSKTLLNATTLLGLKANTPLYEMNSARIYEKPNKKGKYAIFVDVARGRGKDATAFSIINLSKQPYKQVVAYSNNEISPHSIPSVLVQFAKLYNDALIVVESNDYGSIVCKTIKDDLEYENLFFEDRKGFGGIAITTKSKKIGCSNLKDLLEKGRLDISDSQTISELSVFEEKGSSYEAAKGHHDDLVSTLVLFGYSISMEVFSGEYDINLRTVLFNPETIQTIIDSEIPLALVSSRESTDKYTLKGQVELPQAYSFKGQKILKDDVFGVVFEKDEDYEPDFSPVF